MTVKEFLKEIEKFPTPIRLSSERIRLSERRKEENYIMPNWCEGTLKIRGPIENIKKFIENGLNVYSGWFVNNKYEQFEKDKSKWFETGRDGLGEWFCFTDDTIYIEGTQRAFIDNSAGYIYYYEDIEEQNNTIVFRMQQAWDIRTDDWVALSQKYGLDFRLYGVEQGGRFCRELEVINGKATIDMTIKYNDWDWECPFPNMGG